MEIDEAAVINKLTAMGAQLKKPRQLNTWPDIPTFLEIEGLDEKSVRAATESLGFNYADAWFGSIDIIYLKKYGRDILKEPNLLFKP